PGTSSGIRSCFSGHGSSSHSGPRTSSTRCGNSSSDTYATMVCRTRLSAMRTVSRSTSSCFPTTGRVLRNILRPRYRVFERTRGRTATRIRMHYVPSLDETYEQMLSERQPNFLRLYLNPHVAQVCFCLDRYVRTTWREGPASTRRQHTRPVDWQSFLANSLEE